MRRVNTTTPAVATAKPVVTPSGLLLAVSGSSSPSFLSEVAFCSEEELSFLVAVSSFAGCSSIVCSVVVSSLVVSSDQLIIGVLFSLIL